MSSPADRLRENRDSVATGQLSLDRDKARQKLRLFRLASPYQYVLQFVRAASVLGASRITFEIGGRSMQCEFDAVFDGELLRDIWSPMFDERSTKQHEAVRNLALGIASAQALNPQHIEVRSGPTRLVLREEEQELGDVETADSTTIVVEKKFHFGQVVSFVASLMGRLPEDLQLQQYCYYALIDVVVNGVAASQGFDVDGQHVATATPDGDAKAVASTDLASTGLILLRDNVEVARLVGIEHVVGVHAALNSTTVMTDLSGLALQDQPDAEWDSLTAVIHEALLQWLQANVDVISPDELREELERIASYIMQRETAAVAPATRALAEWLLARPLFRSAIIGSETWMSVSRPEGGKTVRFSTSRVPLSGADDVLFLRRGSPITPLLERAGIPTQDVTAGLESLTIRERNHQRWLNQPADFSREFTDAEKREVVNDGTLNGRVQVTTGRGRGWIVWCGRLLQRTTSVLPFDYGIDGDADDLEPNAHFDGVVPDERFDRMALALLRKTSTLFGQLLLHDRTWVLERILAREFEIDVLETLGYSRGAALDLLDRAGLRDNDPLGLELAGPLATMKLFNKQYSLIDLIEAERAPVFVRPQHPMHLAGGRIQLILTSSEKRIVRLVRPDAGEIDETLALERAIEAFESQPPHEDPDLHPIWQHTVNGHHYDLRLNLLPPDNPTETRGTSNVVFVYNGRRLARERWASAVGDWYISVRCDTVEPHPSYQAVVLNDVSRAIRDAIARQQDIALREWVRDRIIHGPIEPTLAAMFAQAAAALLPADELVLPVRRFDGEQWTRQFATLPQLREAASRGGGTLEWCPATVELTGLYLAGDLVLEVEPLALKGTEVLSAVHLVRSNVMPVSASRRRYLEDAPRRSTHDDALYDWHTSVDVVDVHVALYAGEPRLDVEFLWLNRVVERATLDSPGRFVAVVMSPSITANEQLTAVSEGRSQALAAVEVAIKRLIEAACFQIEERQNGYLSERLDRVRDELLRIASRVSGDEAWWPRLHSTPLIETGTGRRSLREQRELEPTPASELLGRVEQILTTARNDRTELLADFTLASLRWSDLQQVALCEAGRHGVTISKEHALCKLAATSGTVGAAFLASCVYTQINAFYAEITDTDEITFQKSLLEVVE